MRPYKKPTDLFLHIEDFTKQHGFAKARVNAEAFARQDSNYEDISIHAIYAKIESRFQHLKETEIALESQVLQVNLEMLQLYNYAQSLHKKINIVSDMYLPKDILTKILHNKGIDNFHALYVSGDCGLTKHTGNLYTKIMQDFNVVANSIVHIGDNPYADIQMAREKGINAIAYTSNYAQYIHADKKAMILDNHANKNLYLSILSGIFAIHANKQNATQESLTYFQSLGYHYAAPLCYGYAKWLALETKKIGITHLLFIARDGFHVKQIFEHLHTDIKTTYMYAPRILSQICYPDWHKLKSEEILQLLQYIITNYKDRFQDLQGNFENLSRDEALSFVVKYQEIFKTIQQQEISNYKNYLLSFLHENEKIGIVDSVTTFFFKSDSNRAYIRERSAWVLL